MNRFWIISSAMKEFLGELITNISQPIEWEGDQISVIQLNQEILDKLSGYDDTTLPDNCWGRESLGCNTEVPDRSIKTLKDDGIFNWIYENMDLSQPRNVAAVIGDIAHDEGMTPLELFNELAA